MTMTCNVFYRIKDLADEKGVSISELERTLNISNGTISKWSHSTPNTKYLVPIAKYFNVSLDYLLGLTNAREIPQDDENSVFYRIDTKGMSSSDVNELKKDITIFTQFLKQRLRENKRKKK